MVEERLELALTVADGAVVSARLASHRALGITRAMAGRPVEDVLGAVPLLFPLCAQAQQVAALEAVESGASLQVPDAHRRARHALVRAEALEGHARALWVEGAALFGSAPDVAAWARLRRALTALPKALYPDGDAGRLGGGRLAPDRGRVGVLLEEAQSASLREALPSRVVDLASLTQWARSASGAGARMVTEVLARGWAGLAPSPRLCPELSPQDVLHGLAQDPAYPERPTLRDGPAEAGPLARQRTHPLVADVMAHHGPGFLARLVARLVELTAWPGDLVAELDALPSAPAHRRPLPPEGDGVGLADTGRGQLAHRVTWEGGRVARWERVAPTEWTHHPDGVATRGPVGWPAHEATARAAWHMALLDPCVPFGVTVEEG